jgi:hypothetical protein
MPQVSVQLRQHFCADLPTSLSVDTRCTPARVLPNTLGCRRQYPGPSDQAVQTPEPLPGMGSSQFREMFKFAEWVNH